MKKIILSILTIVLAAMIIATSGFLKKEVYTCTLKVTPALYEQELTLERYDVRDFTFSRDFSCFDVTIYTPKKTTLQKIYDYYEELKYRVSSYNEKEPLSAEDVAELIRYSTCPEVWGDKYGSSIVVNNGQLFITTYSPVHQEIEKYLIFLKKTNPKLAQE